MARQSPAIQAPNLGLSSAHPRHPPISPYHFVSTIAVHRAWPQPLFPLSGTGTAPFLGFSLGPITNPLRSPTSLPCCRHTLFSQEVRAVFCRHSQGKHSQTSIDLTRSLSPSLVQVVVLLQRISLRLSSFHLTHATTFVAISIQINCNMPPVRTVAAAKPVKTERTHEENQERYVST